MDDGSPRLECVKPSLLFQKSSMEMRMKLLKLHIIILMLPLMWKNGHIRPEEDIGNKINER